MGMDITILYQQIIMDHYKRPQNKGTLDNPDINVYLSNPTCGDRIHLTARIENDVIEDVKFKSDGCAISIAYASIMTSLIKGKDIDTALEITDIFSNLIQGKEVEINEDLSVFNLLKGISKFPARINCATLSWNALKYGLKKIN